MGMSVSSFWFKCIKNAFLKGWRYFNLARGVAAVIGGFLLICFGRWLSDNKIAPGNWALILPAVMLAVAFIILLLKAPVDLCNAEQKNTEAQRERADAAEARLQDRAKEQAIVGSLRTCLKHLEERIETIRKMGPGPYVQQCNGEDKESKELVGKIYQFLETQVAGGLGARFLSTTGLCFTEPTDRHRPREIAIRKPSSQPRMAYEDWLGNIELLSHYAAQLREIADLRERALAMRSPNA